MVFSVINDILSDIFKYNNHLPIIISKPVNTIKNNDNTLANDPHLQFSVEANAVYVLVAYLNVDIKAASDFKYIFTVPAGTAMSGIANAGTMLVWATAVPSVVDVDITAGSRTFLNGSAIESLWAPQMSFIEVGNTAGLVAFQWAQNTAVAEDTIVKKGSTFIVYKTA